MLQHQKLHPQSAGQSGPADKAFVCEICGKAFRFRSNLAEHRSVHTAVKPFVCKFCGKSSRLKGNLTKHILKHHKTEQKDYTGADDYIIKKGKKSVKDPAAIDFIEKSMIVLNSQQPSSIDNNDSLDGQDDDDNSITVKRESLDLDAADSQQPCLLFSFGLDAGSIDLKAESSPPETSGLGNMEFLFRSSTNDQLLEKCNAAMEVDDFNAADNEDQVETPRTSSSAAHSLNEIPHNSASINSINLPASSAAALAAAACKALLMGQQNSVGGCSGRFKPTNRGSFGGASSQNAGSDVDGGELGPLVMATDSAEEDDNNGDNADEISCLDFLRNQQNTSSNDIATPKSSSSYQNGSPTSTKCPECGKHLRKPRDLIAHLATIHKIPPTQRPQPQQQPVNGPSSLLYSIGHQNGDSHSPAQGISSVKSNLNRQSVPRQSDGYLNPNETGNISQELRQINTSLTELKGQMNTQKVEQLMVNLDSRVGRLEKQLEMALNSIYTLVQLHVQQQRR